MIHAEAEIDPYRRLWMLHEFYTRALREVLFYRDCAGKRTRYL